MSQHANIIDTIIQAFHAHGDMEYGERVNLREHMLQAAVFAERDQADDLLIAAAVLHDYGHFVHGLGEDIADQGLDGRHEEVGAEALKAYFMPAVIEPLRLHVAAKRYLCAVDAAYFATISPASLQSLALQGGPFTPAEVHAFEQNPYFERAVKLRHYDEAGKVPGMPTPPIEHYRPYLERALLTSDTQ
jgi:phosphonate degradation associated HDIG domain protein